MSNHKKILALVVIFIFILVSVFVINSVNKDKKANEGAQNVITNQNTEAYANSLTNNTNDNSQKYTAVLSDGSKINISDTFNQSKKYKDIEISNIQFIHKDEKSVLLANVKNVGSTIHESEVVKMTILDENNETIYELKPVIPKVETGETEKMNIIISGAKSVNAKDFKIEAE